MTEKINFRMDGFEGWDRILLFAGFAEDDIAHRNIEVED